MLFCCETKDTCSNCGVPEKKRNLNVCPSVWPLPTGKFTIFQCPPKPSSPQILLLFFFCPLSSTFRRKLRFSWHAFTLVKCTVPKNILQKRKSKSKNKRSWSHTFLEVRTDLPVVLQFFLRPGLLVGFSSSTTKLFTKKESQFSKSIRFLIAGKQDELIKTGIDF